MTKEEAYAYAGLTPEEMSELDEDAEAQRGYVKLTHQLEYALLDNMRKGSLVALQHGNTGPTEWLLEHLYPRFNKKSDVDVGGVTLSFDSALFTPSDHDEVHP